MFNMKIDALDKNQIMFANIDERSKFYLNKLEKVRKQ